MTTIENEKHCILPRKEIVNNDVLCFEEYWETYSQSNQRKIKIQENKKSYLWDKLLEKSFEYIMNGTLRSTSHCDYNQQAVLFCRFAKPTRVERRILSEAFVDSWLSAKKRVDFTGNKMQTFIRRSVFASFPDTMLTIVWLHKPDDEQLESFLNLRKGFLQNKMLSSIPQFPHIRYHIGIAKTIEIEDEDSEDFIYIDSEDYPPESDAVKEATSLIGELPAAEIKTYNTTINEYSASKTIQKIPFPTEFFK